MNRSEYSANRALAASRVLDYSQFEMAPRRTARPAARRTVRMPAWVAVAGMALLAALPVLARAFA